MPHVLLSDTPPVLWHTRGGVLKHCTASQCAGSRQRKSVVTMGAVVRGRDGLPTDLESRLQQAVIYSQVRNVKESAPDQPQGLPPPRRVGRDLTSTLEQLWANTQNPGSNKQYGGVWDHAQQGSASSGDRPSNLMQPKRGGSGASLAISTSSSASWSTIPPGITKSPFDNRDQGPGFVETGTLPQPSGLPKAPEFDTRAYGMPDLTRPGLGPQYGNESAQPGTAQREGSGYQTEASEALNPPPPAAAAAAGAQPDGSEPDPPPEDDFLAQWLQEVSAVEPVPVGADFMDEDFMRGLGGLEEAFQDLEDLLPQNHWDPGPDLTLDMDLDFGSLDYPSPGTGSGTDSIPVPPVSGTQGPPLSAEERRPRTVPRGSTTGAPGEAQGDQVAAPEGVSKAAPNPIELLVSIARAIVAGNISEVQSELTQLTSIASTYGSASQRMSAYFLEGLMARVSGVPSSGQTPTPVYETEPMACNNHLMRAFEVIVNASPYLTFGQLASSSAILEAFEGERAVHVIDFGMGFGIQWESFIQAMATRAGGPPQLRITGVDIGSPNKFKRAHCVVETGRRLMEIAKSWGVPFEYHALPCRMEEVHPREMNIRQGEAVAVNCALRLHNLLDENATPSNPRSAVLRTIRALNPKIVTIVEQTTNQSSPFFLSRFYEALHYYTTMFEAIGDSMPEDSNERRVFEQQVLGKTIVNVVACEGQERTERQEPLEQWQRRVGKAGFVPSRITDAVMQTVNALLKTYKEGYNFVKEGEGSIVLTWKDRPMLSMSAWKSDPTYTA